MTKGRHCFGYGSLVNQDTHDFRTVRRTKLTGWRRTWSHRVSANGRHVSSLTIEPAPAVTIHGLISYVAPDQIAGLNARESGYDMIELPTHAFGPQPEQHPTFTYVSANNQPGDEDHPILQSYLDCVLAGFFAEFGEMGIDDFLKTTTGWDTPIRADRHNPEYPRAVALSDDLTDLIDDALHKLGASFISQAR